MHCHDDDDGKVKGSSGGVSGFAGRQAKATRKEKIWWSPATYSVFVASEYIWARQNQVKKIIIWLNFMRHIFQQKKAKNKDGFQSIPGSRYPHSDVDCPPLRICHVFVPVPLDLAPISLLCRNEPSFFDFLPFEMSLTPSIPCWTMLMLNVFCLGWCWYLFLNSMAIFGHLNFIGQSMMTSVLTV